ncbi:MAG: response regulator [Magnetococcales bacterium]|nr:response regulator [Magnetococcales bacterium]
MKKATVLVVDDEVGIVEGLQDWLEINGHSVYTASSGIKALEVLAEQSIDIMITDLRMPGMGGLELLTKVPDVREGICSIVLTGHGDMSNAIKALNNGAVAYMLKPVDLDELGIHLGRCIKQVEMKRQLVLNLRYLESIIESMADALIVISPDGTVQTVNRLACDMLEYSEEEMVGKKLENFASMHSIFGENGFEDLLKNGFLSSFDTTIVSKNDRETPVLLSGSVHRDLTEEVTGVVLVAKDITDYKRSQTILREREAQLVHTGRLTAMGEMAAGIAHELNQPLAVIRIWSQSLGNDVGRGSVSAERVTEATKEIDQQMKRATTIITHMRAFARGESDEPPEATDLAVPANEALLFFQEQFRIHEIELDMQIGENLPEVSLHAGRFEQVVVNLLSNARHAVDKKRSEDSSFQKKIALRLYASDDNKWVILEVADNGIGMSTHDRDRCLEPFFTTKEVGQGTGLGLHIIRGIVQEMNGRIHVDSQLGKGATFKIQLPAA